MDRTFDGVQEPKFGKCLLISKSVNISYAWVLTTIDRHNRVNICQAVKYVCSVNYAHAHTFAGNAQRMHQVKLEKHKPL